MMLYTYQVRHFQVIDMRNSNFIWMNTKRYSGSSRSTEDRSLRHGRVLERTDTIAALEQQLESVTEELKDLKGDMQTRT